MWDDDNRSELEIAWDNFKDTLKQVQPFKIIHDMIIKMLDWLSTKFK